jgi:DNA-binding GntR family transcriptional regulator
MSLHAKVARIERRTLADRVYDDIKSMLIQGTAAPGERLTLRGMAEALGTSPMPVRDAVSRLVAESALEILPNRTVFNSDLQNRLRRLVDIDAHAHHARMLEGIRSGDGALAREAVVADIRSAARFLLSRGMLPD